MEIVKIDLPTRNGAFTGVAFRNSSSEAFALVKGWPVEGAENLLVRVHSGCLEGDVFSSQLCDCREQLEKALELISKEKKYFRLRHKQYRSYQERLSILLRIFR